MHFYQSVESIPTDSPEGKSPSKFSFPNEVTLRVHPVGSRTQNMYKGNQHFHEGDSGLDLFFLKRVSLPRKQTIDVKLGSRTTAWQGDRKVGWLLMLRPSMASTRLCLANSVGVIDATFRGEVTAASMRESACCKPSLFRVTEYN